MAAKGNERYALAQVEKDLEFEMREIEDTQDMICTCSDAYIF